MIFCKDCVHSKQVFCCEGCDTPGGIPLGSCAHYRRRGE